jgi:glutamate/tyrosine decarboxylase-like PLP-dependent enzyme
MATRVLEETLDPENWDETRALSHRILDDMMDYLQNIRNQPFTPLTEEAKKAIQSQLPKKGDGEEEVYNTFKEHIVPHSFQITRPDLWGNVAGTGSLYGMLTDMVISGINSGSMFLTFIDKQSIDWIKELLEYPQEAGGVFVSGGSEANFTGLAVARNAKAEVNMKTKGMQGLDRKMVLYGSEETHHCLERSVELLGLGNDALRWIKTDDEYRIAINSLKDSIIQDRKQGYHPFCIIGNAGTVNTGAFDDLNALADLCERENLWFHVDGAFGAWVKLSEKFKYLADGMERADSLAVDLHKWISMPYGIGCTLVKDRVAHFSTFVYGHDAKYLKATSDITGEVLDVPWNLALGLSRPHYGLKAYMLLRAFGRDKYSDLVQQNIDQIHYFAELVRKEPNMEITAPVISNVACFRYVHNGVNESDIDILNQMILTELWKINALMISSTTINSKYMLRACNVNNRTKYSDFNILVERIKSIGKTLAKEYH